MFKNFLHDKYTKGFRFDKIILELFYRNPIKCDNNKEKTKLPRMVYFIFFFYFTIM